MHSESSSNISAGTRRLTAAALLMAVNIGLSSFGIPVPGGHLYFCDIAVVAAALLLDPAAAFIVGGVGSFLGDFFFYPVTMFVSLFVHGFQAALISWFIRHVLTGRPKLSAFLGIALGAVLMIVGYSLAGPTFTAPLPMPGSSSPMKSSRVSWVPPSALSWCGNGSSGICSGTFWKNKTAFGLFFYAGKSREEISVPPRISSNLFLPIKKRPLRVVLSCTYSSSSSRSMSSSRVLQLTAKRTTVCVSSGFSHFSHTTFSEIFS